MTYYDPNSQYQVVGGVAPEAEWRPAPEAEECCPVCGGREWVNVGFTSIILACKVDGASKPSQPCP